MMSAPETKSEQLETLSTSASDIESIDENTGEALAVLASVLSHLFRFPFDEDMALFFKAFDVDDKDDMFVNVPTCHEGIVLIKTFFSDDDLSDALLTASNDFHKLFVGPANLLAAPWSSVYMDSGSLFGPTDLAVEELFEEHGFTIPEGNREPCDHIAYELAFLLEMHKSASEAAALKDEKTARKYYETALMFKENYLDPWMGEFLDAVEAGARVDVYRGVALLTRGFLALEDDFLRSVTNEREGVFDNGLHAV